MLVFVYAAVRIQRLARGFVVRKHGSLRQVLTYRATRVQALALRKKAIASSNRQLDKYLSYLDKANNRIRQGGGSSHIKASAKPLWLDSGYSSWCAARIQAFWRMVKPRRRFLYKKRFVLQIATLVIQTAYRTRLELKRQLLRSREFSYIASISSPRRREDMRNFAARKIQQRWRCFCNRRIFRYFRELVCFKLQGAPSDLLKTIVPRETGLFDRASGVHVRFRLGGAVFPPKVFFKVFTHRPLCDVNAFAPRDYTRESKPDAFHNNNYENTLPKYGKYARSIRVGAKYFDTVVKTSAADTATWYRRKENNPWRPIAAALVEEVLTPPWQRDAPREKKLAPFHFSTYKRREEQLREKKRRKRQWMLKAYLLATGTGTGTGGGGEGGMNDDVFDQQQEEHWGMGEQKRDAYAEGKDGSSSRDLDLLWADKATLSHSRADGADVYETEAELELADLSLADESKSISARGYHAGSKGEPVPRLEHLQQLQHHHRHHHHHHQQQRNVDKTIVDVIMPSGGAQGLAAALRAHRPVEHVEDEDLLDWSATLDFDQYYSNWQAVGTSSLSSSGPGPGKR